MRRLRDTSMPRAQMVRFVELRRQGDATATERRMLLEERQRALEQRMRQLEQHMAALQQKISRIKAVEARRNEHGVAEAPEAMATQTTH
ncbi:MAG TPA: hypothetical protein VFW76_09750 [Ktedonobacterales bacterium]|nr:hypothetical protein [Ktedonobacterales bacterium]